MGYGNVLHYSPIVFGLCVIFFIQFRWFIRCFIQSIDTLTNQSVSQKLVYVRPTLSRWGCVWQRKSRQHVAKVEKLEIKHVLLKFKIAF